jgi:hypothetical protein
MASAPRTAAAQRAGTPRLGALNAGVPFPHLDAAFVQGLRELGWHDGQNILIEWRHAHGEPERLPELVAELMRLKVDLFVSFHNPTTTAIKRATTTIPIVMRFAIDPIGQGYVKSLAHPGANITGVAWDPNPDIAAKYPELLKQVAPHISRVAGPDRSDLPWHRCVSYEGDGGCPETRAGPAACRGSAARRSSRSRRGHEARARSGSARIRVGLDVREQA